MSDRTTMALGIVGAVLMPLVMLGWLRAVAAAVVLFLVALILAAIAYLIGTPGPQAAERLPRSPYDAQMLALERQALDEAFRAQINQLFVGWLRDSTDQPERATRGAIKARKAYIQVMQHFELRAAEGRPP